MWSAVVFWILLLPLVVTLIITYLTGKKIYRLVYIVAIFTYAMTVMYTIDAYELSKNWILILLIVSSALMIYTGTLFRRKRKKTKSKQYWISIISVALILAITLFSGSGIGLDVQKQATAQLSKQEVFQQQMRLPVYEISIQNSIIPRQYRLPDFEACFVKEDTRRRAYANVEPEAERGLSGERLLSVGAGETSKATYYLNAENMPKPVDPDFRPEEYDMLVLYERKTDYRGCYELSEQDIKNSVKIPIV